MNYKQAREYHLANPNAEIYMARYDGRVWSAGRMVDVGDVISYHLTKDDAEAACREYEINDFDRGHLYTSVELCDANEFEEAAE